MEENKIQLVQEFEESQLVELVISLAKNKGFNNVSLSPNISNLVLGKIDTPLGVQNHGFLIFRETLTQSNYDNIFDEILKCVKEYHFNNTYVVSSSFISNSLKSSLTSNIYFSSISFIEREQIVGLIDQHKPTFWENTDTLLLDYETHFCDNIMNDSELKRLKIFDDRYKKLLDIFIEPNIYHYYEKPNTNTFVRDRITFEKIITTQNSFFISGSAGSGKTTLLKRIGKAFIDNNRKSITKTIPVFISIENIISDNYDITSSIQKVVNKYFNLNYEDISKKYRIVLLIDTIDELDNDNQKRVVKDISNICKENNILFILGSRNAEKLIAENNKLKVYDYRIEKFNFEQIKKFVNLFFKGNGGISEQLLEALKENKTIEKLPITPLTLSLISILYEENNLEIPATVTDIYDNFNYLLLGKATVSNRFEFIDISFKERILSLYALEILNRKDNSPMTLEEVKMFFENYFNNKTIPLRGGSITDAVDYLINHTGVLGIKHNKYVHFTHDSFMEYYAALEIFKHQRNIEDSLVENFFQANWQNTAVFYAGKSKDMPEFLNKIRDKLKNATKLSDFIMGVFGAGYILQALYQTDNKLRKEVLLEALELNVKQYEIFQKLSADEQHLMKNFKLPVLTAISILSFFESFHSITLKHPLKEAFKQLFKNFEETGNETDGFKALKIAFTLASKKLDYKECLEQLIFSKQIDKSPLLLLSADLALNAMIGGSSSRFDIFKKELKRDMRKYTDSIKILSNNPVSKLRFSPLNNISFDSQVIILTEGKTDCEILEHAFITLTGGDLPYWKVKPAGNQSGGAAEVNKTLIQAKPIIKEGEILIGIFDRDDKGIGEFNRLPNNVFDEIQTKVVKKHKDSGIYAICLPISDNRNNYIKQEQVFNYFEIEHYFSDEYLSNHNMIKETEIPDIFKIIDSKKKEFSSIVRKELDPKVFANFIILFNLIDEITGNEIIYHF